MGNATASFFVNFAIRTNFTTKMPSFYYISRNYKHPGCGGVIARRDIETVLDRMGFENIGLKPTFSRSGLTHVVRNHIGAMKAARRIKSGDVVVLQYPMSAYFSRICRTARTRGARVVALIHDLSSFRNKSLTPAQEMALLNQADVLLTHNHRMRQWLAGHGCTVKMIDYEIMDYLGGESSAPHHPEAGRYSIYFVGNLSRAQNAFLYELAAMMPETEFYFYGPEAETAGVPANVRMMGVVKDIEIIRRHHGDFGISWYGSSLSRAVGRIGEYMEYNNPHKVGLYLRGNSPVIVWKNAGRAQFIEREGIGVAVGALTELPALLKNLKPEEYAAMLANVERVNRRLAEGYYLQKAMREAFDYLGIK